MAKTLNTSATPYAAPGDLLPYIDLRVVGDLCSDNGTRIASGALAANVNFLAAIKAACARVEMAAFRGKRYLAADLLAIAASTGVAQGGFFRLLADLTVVGLYKHRADLEIKQPWIYEESLKDLEALANGEEVFPFLETEEAGLPDSLIETARDVEARGGITFIAERYFGTRGNRRPLRGG